MLKLYGGARSRASIVQWYLEELELPYEFVLLDFARGEHLQPPYLAINPFGKVPAIADGDFTLWESGAILLYLSEKYDSTQWTAEQRATQAQWVLFANATLGTGIFVEASREREMPRLLGALDRVLAQQEYLLSKFSVADVAVGSLLWYIPLMLKLSFADYPAIEAYLKRLGDRSGFQKSLSAMA